MIDTGFAGQRTLINGGLLSGGQVNVARFRGSSSGELAFDQVAEGALGV